MEIEEEAFEAERKLAPPMLGEHFGWVIVELAPDGILVVDEAGCIMLANSKIEKMFGHPRPQLVGARVETLMPHRFRAGHFRTRHDYSESPSARPMGIGQSLQGLHADGSEFPVEISLSPITTGAGVQTVVIIRDHTRHDAAARANRTRREADEQERIALELNTTLIHTIHGVGLKIAGLTNQVDQRTAQALLSAVDDLDRAVSAIRSTVFRDRPAQPPPD
jgi:PAS domain S-box-containing protein